MGKTFEMKPKRREAAAKLRIGAAKDETLVRMSARCLKKQPGSSRPPPLTHRCLTDFRRSTIMTSQTSYFWKKETCQNRATKRAGRPRSIRRAPYRFRDVRGSFKRPKPDLAKCFDEPAPKAPS